MSKKNYYLFNPGRMSRKDNTLKFVRIDENDTPLPAKYLPIEGIKSLYVFGSVDANSALYSFLGRSRVPVHFFDYYGHYSGSFQPKEFLHAGKMLVAQTKSYLNSKRRKHIAQSLVRGSAKNMLRNLKYYNNRNVDLAEPIETIESLIPRIDQVNSIEEIMGIEGNCHIPYYASFDRIIPDFPMLQRSKRPPSNEVNALMSFGNMMCYSLCLDQIYHTQLNPTISFLHEPGTRRYSLALDIAEIFKPLLVDRLIFRLLNRKEIQKKHFRREVNSCLLNEQGKKIFIKAWEDRIQQTIKHRQLKRKVSYQRMIKLELYKMAKFMLDIEAEYKPFVIWW